MAADGVDRRGQSLSKTRFHTQTTLACPAGTVARRDSAERQQVPLARMSAAVGALFEDVEASLLRTARAGRELARPA